MQVMIVSPRRVLLAGVVSALLVAGSVLGALALWGFFRADHAEAYGDDGVGAKTWYFPEGYTGPGFEEWILIYNPHEVGSGKSIKPIIYMYGKSGYIGRYDCPSIQPGQRFTVKINDAAAQYGYMGDIFIEVAGTIYEG